MPSPDEQGPDCVLPRLASGALAGQGDSGAVEQRPQAVLEGLLAERAAALADSHQQGGRGAAVEQLGQRSELLSWRLGVLLGAGLLAALRVAVEAASLSVSRRGTLSSFPSVAEAATILELHGIAL